MWKTSPMFLAPENNHGTLGNPEYWGLPAMARRKPDTKTKDLFAYADDNLRPTIVYMATNQVNGKRYIGLTRRHLSTRRRQHAAQAAHKPGGMPFCHAIRKYGIDAFEFVVLTTCETYRNACREEQRQIAERKPEYNVSKGGEGPIGVRRDAKHSERMRAMNLGRPSPRKGVPASEETKAKLRAAWGRNPERRRGYWLGKKRDEATLRKVSASKKGICTIAMRIALLARAKWVICLNDGLRFKGTGEAGRHYGLLPRSIADVCRGKTRTIKGRRFRYEDQAP